MNTGREHATCTPLNSMSRISWGAIIGGAFIAMFFQLLLGLLGLAVGLTALNPAEAVPIRGLTIAGSIWLVLITIVSVFIGAFAAGRFAGLSAKYDGLLHGVATLAFLAVLSIFLVSSGVSNVVGGAFTYGLQAAKIPQVQQMMPSPSATPGGTTGAASNIQSMTPQQQMIIKKQADKFATRTTWLTFVTSLLALILAAVGGYLGMQSRVKQIIREGT